MGWLARIEGKAAPALADFWPHDWVNGGAGGLDPVTKERVTPETAISATAVWAALVLVAGTIATLPVGLYRRDGKRRLAMDDHPSVPLLRLRPNRWMTATAAFEAMQGRVMWRGNAYAQVLRTRTEEPAEIIPLDPDRVRVEVARDGLLYRYNHPVSGEVTLPGTDVVHVRGFSPTGIVGYDPVELMRPSLGVTLAADRHGARFFGNAARPSGIIRTDRVLGPAAKANIAAAWATVAGGENAHRTAVLDEGMQWQAVGLSANDAQLLETRRFQILEVSRIFGVPPHLLRDLERATFSNISEQSLEFEKHTIRPWLTRWEQALAVTLLTAAERDAGFFYRFNVDGLLRGALENRLTAYQAASGVPWMSTNDVRSLEDMDPVDDGDEIFVPLNMVPRSSAGEPDVDGNGAGLALAAAGDGPRGFKERREERLGRMRRRSRNLLASQIARAARPLVAAEVRDVRRALNETRGAGEFLVWMRSRFRNVRNTATDALRPVLEDYGVAAIALVEAEVGPPPRPIESDVSLLAREYADTAGARWEAHTLGRLDNLVAATGDTYAERVAEEMDRWEDGRVETIAAKESVRADGALVNLAYTLVGVVALRWVANAGACPLCRKMHGRRVGIADAFLSSGSTFNADGAAAPLRAEHDVRHAPLHGGCTCFVMAAL